ncbi:winged helix-turn-helix domain-containing protein [Variovorax sp. W6]|uniref:winged helix-turn-helix domain-containing protein n=1 Tax=Variovorax sp. W6 TaxID=3093895 RepID=UPI003D80916F
MLTRNGAMVPMSAGAAAMLGALARRPRQPQSREELARLTRSCPDAPLSRSVDLQVSRLRKLVEADPAMPRFIQTVRGFGYVFEPNGAVRCWSSGAARSPAMHQRSRPTSWYFLGAELRMDAGGGDAAFTVGGPTRT